MFFISHHSHRDLHSFPTRRSSDLQTPENYRYKARDGVTTALEMEVGVNPVDAWYREREGRALVNYGATSGDLPSRIAVMHDSGTLLPRDKAVERAATPAEQQQIRGRIGT